MEVLREPNGADANCAERQPDRAAEARVELVREPREEGLRGAGEDRREHVDDRFLIGGEIEPPLEDEHERGEEDREDIDE